MILNKKFIEVYILERTPEYGGLFYAQHYVAQICTKAAHRVYLCSQEMHCIQVHKRFNSTELNGGI